MSLSWCLLVFRLPVHPCTLVALESWDDVHDFHIESTYDVWYNLSQRLHVWNIYLHLPQKSPSHVGKYTIHGAFGINQPFLKPLFLSHFVDSPKRGLEGGARHIDMCGLQHAATQRRFRVSYDEVFLVGIEWDILGICKTTSFRYCVGNLSIVYWILYILWEHEILYIYTYFYVRIYVYTYIYIQSNISH